MTENKKANQAYTLNAIEAVTRQGMRRYRLILQGILIVIVIGLLIIWYLPAEKAKWPVAILLPDMEKEGAVQENAKRQWAGFELAFNDNDVAEDKHRHFFQFSYPLKTKPRKVDDNSTPEDESKPKDDDSLEDNDKSKDDDKSENIDYCKASNDSVWEDSRKAINDKIKCWYDEGIRTFIITMSGATLKIKRDFSEWADTLPSNDRPVLLATVASAPELADRKSGVFRHYIRSKDESDMIATYIESINPSPSSIGIFYVIDAYGRDAKNLLKNRLNLKKETWVNVYGVSLKDALDTQINNLVKEFETNNNKVAVIIGYGPMIKYTLNSINKLSSFKGPILVVSTFTEEGWRPDKIEDKSFHNRIRFVGPSIDIDEDNAAWRGVVFQFSYLTLDRALKCKGERGVENFWSCFTNAELSSTGKHWAPHIEFTELGDSHISLRLLEMSDGNRSFPQCPEPEEATTQCPEPDAATRNSVTVE